MCDGELSLQGTVYVSKESIEAYTSHAVWGKYPIKSIDEYSSINYPVISFDNPDIFDINGLRLEAKGKGLRILRSKGKTKKVVTK